MIPDKSFVIEVKQGGTKFTNNTPYLAWISENPIPPKRKIRDVAMVKPETFAFFDDFPFKIDLTRITISFTES